VGEQNRDAQHEIEHDRRRGGGCVAIHRIQQARKQRNERHADEIGESDPRQRRREGELVGVIREAESENDNQPRHRDLRDRGDEKQHGNQARHGLLRERVRGFLAIRLEALGKERHEGRIEGALGEQSAEQVRDSEGDDERIRDRARAEHRGDQDVADKAEDAAHHGESADRREGAVELHLW